jgi:ankyrin repeat protein
LAYRSLLALPCIIYVCATVQTCSHDFGDGGHPLIDRVIAGDAAGVKVLLDQGNDPNDTNMLDRHRRALQYAAASGRVDIAEMLIRHGADVNAMDNHNGTALTWTHDSTMVALLKRYGARY